MANGASTEARDRIGEALHARDKGFRGFADESSLPDDCVGWYSATEPKVAVFLHGAKVIVQVAGVWDDKLRVPADAPDLLDQLDATLTGRGV